MSEQSTVVAMFRAVVMLLCLIAIPMAALFGTSLPTVVKAVQEGRWPTLADLKGAIQPAKSPATEPAPFVPSGIPASISGGTAPLFAGDRRPQASPTNTPTLPPQFPGASTGYPASGVMPAGFESPVASVRGADPQTAGAFGRPTPPSQLATPFMPKDSAQAPAEQPGDGVPRAVSGESSQQPTSSGSDPFSLIQDRLRQLGATYYLLESWGDQKREFRFYCRMAIGGNSQYTRSFWHIDSDPLRAMGQVLQQVESWRSERP